MSIGENIKALREKAGLSQEQLGEIVGKSRSTVSLWENGTIEPRRQIIKTIADYFKIDYFYFYDVAKVKDSNINPFKDVPDDKVEYSLRFDSDDSDDLMTARVITDSEYNKKKLLENYDKLNDDGQGHLVEYSYVLTKMEEYQSE